MMSIKLDWDKLRRVHQHLAALPTLNNETNIIFVMIMADQKARKSLVKFKDFMNFMWSLSENPDYQVLTLVVQDEEGRVLYRHKTLTSGNEEVPSGGNVNVIAHWGALTQPEKDTYIRMLEAQIQAYEQ
jgi:hypothetical protein